MHRELPTSRSVNDHMPVPNKMMSKYMAKIKRKKGKYMMTPEEFEAQLNSLNLGRQGSIDRHLVTAAYRIDYEVPKYQSRKMRNEHKPNNSEEMFEEMLLEGKDRLTRETHEKRQRVMGRVCNLFIENKVQRL